ncbi:Flp family type IVb pilin [Jiella marina]|uniref:Flp family type IVb pilin n=1 Tax=Jiella sp. LLJ827 TaxID=2917712 RepID=UPI002100F9B2|nr:Flp family type IVb pilin [Jiella sp. LLJ827]
MTPAARRLRSAALGEFERFHQSRSGATAIEYAVIAMLIGIALVGSVQLIGPGLSSSFSDLAPSLKPKS